MKLTRANLLQYVDYDKDSGIFTWRERTEEMIPIESGRKSFNGQYAGEPAGSIDGKSGNMRIMIAGKYRYAKSLAYLAVIGKVPGRIEHRDGDKSNIKWTNLTTQKVLQVERKAAEKIEIVHEVMPGVVYSHYRGAYRAFVNLAFVVIAVGYFKSLEAATAARDDKLMEMKLL